MLVSLDKNIWLYEWLTQTYGNEIYEIIDQKYPPRLSDLRKQLAKLLISKGYKAHWTSGDDIIIAMTEEEYIFLKLKYE